MLPFHWHLAETLVVVAALVAHRAVVKDARLRRLALAGLVTLLVVTVWPVGDLAAEVSLSVATLQRLAVMLLVAPLVLLATPIEVWARLNRPAPIDAAVRALTHPLAAVVVVTVVGTATLTPAVVDWGARSALARDGIVAVTLLLGLELWTPALVVVPGTRRLSPLARAGYLFVAALVVTSLSFVWIFARHPLYPGLHDQFALVHLTPIVDQQVAGFVAKLGAYLPMWATAITMFYRAEMKGVPVEEATLHWADVERHLERADRRRARTTRRRPG